MVDKVTITKDTPYSKTIVLHNDEPHRRKHVRDRSIDPLTGITTVTIRH